MKLRLAFCAALAAFAVNAATFYVAPTGDDAASGLSWETAKKSIQAAVDAAVDDDSVVVTNGVYAPFTLYRDELPTGLWLTVESVNGPDVTIIDGGGTACCAILLSVDGILTGFTLRNGSSDLGGGAYGGTLRHCVVTGNTAVNGGGTYSSLLEYCTVVNNRATA